MLGKEAISTPHCCECGEMERMTKSGICYNKKEKKGLDDWDLRERN